MSGIKLSQIHKRLDSSGFTLVELLVTIMVAIVLVGAVSSVSNNNAYLSQRGRDLTVANSYAENKVEELRSQGYQTLINGTNDLTSEMPSELKAPRSANLTISDADIGLKLVALTLTYSDGGKTQSQTYKTYVGELGVGQY